MTKGQTYRRIFSIFALAFICAGIGQAQGRYANTYSRSDVNGFIRSLENSSDVFAREFRGAGRPTDGEKRAVDQFENAVDRLRRRFDRGDSWWQSRNEVQAMMPNAQQVNSLMLNQRYARRLERQWRDLRRDINKLADTYDLPGVAGGGWNGGFPGNPGGPIGGNVPNWAVGTFRARNPQDGRNMSMTIRRNGAVSINFQNGGRAFGTIYGNTLTVNGATSTISQIRNGVRTTRTDNGERINYYRN